MNKKLLEIHDASLLTTPIKADFLIISGSPEERCIGALDKIKDGFKASNIFLLRYSHFNQKREENINEMKRIINGCSMGSITEFTLDEASPIPVINEIVSILIKTRHEKKNVCIVHDISTLIKWHILMFLRAYDISGLFDRIQFIYTEPKDYLIDLFRPLSFGLKELFPVPLFTGNYEFSKDCLLAIMLGYEGDRATALLDNIDPSECILFITKPAYHPEWEGRTEEMNKEIINIVGEKNIFYIDSRNPLLVSNQINEVIAPNYSGYNCLLSPMGTKPQTIGLYLYWASHQKNNSLIYSAPLRHNDLFYSEGIGKTWLLPLI